MAIEIVITEQGLTGECTKPVKSIKLTRTYEQPSRQVDNGSPMTEDEYHHPRYPGEHTD